LNNIATVGCLKGSYAEIQGAVRPLPFDAGNAPTLAFGAMAQNFNAISAGRRKPTTF